MAPADPLTELRDRVHAAQAAAERLAGEARTQARELPHETRDELDALVGLLRTLRELVPPELQQQLSEVIRQVLLLLRAVIDFWVERLEAPRGRGGGVEVRDIPIE
jgi:signal transduction histidine kinase